MMRMIVKWGTPIADEIFTSHLSLCPPRSRCTAVLLTHFTDDEHDMHVMVAALTTGPSPSPSPGPSARPPLETAHVCHELHQVAINSLEHIPSMTLLLLGRVLGGISTSLLFSAFESWMVSEHRKQGEEQI